MTTYTPARAASHRITLEDLKNVQSAVEAWVRRARASLEDSRTDRWNRDQRSRLESRGDSFTSYFLG